MTDKFNNAAWHLQYEMNLKPEVREKVQEFIPGFIAVTVDHKRYIEVYQLHLWIDGHEHGGEKMYRLDWSVDANINIDNDEDRETLWRQMGERITNDIKELVNG